MMTWKTVKFGDVVRQVKDKVDPQTAGLERYVAGEHMDTDNLHIRRWGEVGDGYLGPAFHMRFQPGHVLYGSRRTYLRKVAVADFEGITANTTYVIEPRDPEVLLPDFLPFVMSTETFHEHSIKQSKGSVNPYINFSDIAWYEFSLPPVDEQRRIADLLWAADDEIDSFRQLFDEAVKLETSLKLSILSANNHKIKLGSLVEEGKLSFKTGPFGTVLKASSYVKKGIPVVNPVNMSDGKFYVEDGPFVSEQEAKRLEIYKIFENDLIFGRKGDIGRGIFATKESEGYLFGSDCICVRVIGKSILPKYLFYFLTSPNSKRLLSAQSHGTTMPGINEKMLSRMEISIPEESEQLEIIKKLEQVDETKSQIQERISASTELKKALLQKLLA
ncbi:MAG: restriction endonuclease subunit S [Chloroflexi bacterium]|nr:restriction endonuclease subunit S [Chloroflexota bacterium]